MDIELLQGTLEVSETPGLETIDPRFSDIAALTMEGRYDEAAARSVEIIEQEIYDIRIIGYALYGHFLDHGIRSIAEINHCLVSLLQDNLEALGPLKKREKHIQTVLNWLMKQFLKKMQYEEEKQSSLYESWASEVSSDEVGQALDAMDELRRALGIVLEDAAGPVLDGLGKVNDWLTAFQKLVYKEPEPEAELEPELEPEYEPEKFEEEETIEPERRAVDQSTTPLIQEGTGVEGSYHLNLLMRKLEAFDYLISEEKYASAALVADDIYMIIADFDPKLYFPKLFSRFSLLLAANINDLLAYNEYKESPGWQAMKELYKVDLEGFVKFNVDNIAFDSSFQMGGNSEEANEYGSDYEEEDPYQEDELDGDDESGEEEVW